MKEANLQRPALRCARCGHGPSTHSHPGGEDSLSDLPMRDDLVEHTALCCMGRGSGRTGPYPVLGQAMRTDSGRPRPSMRLRAWTPTLTSVTRRRLVRECNPSPITRLYREIAASARARAL